MTLEGDIDGEYERETTFVEEKDPDKYALLSENRREEGVSNSESRKKARLLKIEFYIFRRIDYSLTTTKKN